MLGYNYEKLLKQKKPVVRQALVYD